MYSSPQTIEIVTEQELESVLGTIRTCRLFK